MQTTVAGRHRHNGCTLDAVAKQTARGHLGKRTLRFTRNGEPAEAPTAEEAPLAIELAGARCEPTVDGAS